MPQVRLRLVEIIVAVCVVIISLASLFVAVFQGVVMQRTLETSVLPALTYNHGNFDTDRQMRRLTLTIGSVGLGPAEMHSVHFTYEGQRLDNIQDVLLACCSDPELEDAASRQAALVDMIASERLPMFTNVLEGALLAPGATLSVAELPWPEDEAARAVWERLNQARWAMRVEACYCSAFGQCWRADFAERARRQVRRCS
ncbi:MAG: hypothetical protein GC187_06955 [Alphaproteobacteria bacterium]|nr:hypothetical protein [Alphaproteobacteria bacterium]